MRFFPGSYIVMAAIFVIIGVFAVQPGRAYGEGETVYKCSDNQYHLGSCVNYGGFRCKDGTSAATKEQCQIHHGGFFSKDRICGDGWVDIGEQCDDGAYGSDNRPNACRTDCRNAYCGDGIVDTGEECDDGNYNNLDGCRDCTAFGMVDSGKMPMIQQPQGREKLQPGGFLPGMAKPGAVGGRPNLLPGRQPTIGKPGKPVAPLGTPSPGRGIVRGPSPASLGTKGMPVDPYDAKSMPPDPLGTKSMPIDPYGSKKMPIDPLGHQ